MVRRFDFFKRSKSEQSYSKTCARTKQHSSGYSRRNLPLIFSTHLIGIMRRFTSLMRITRCNHWQQSPLTNVAQSHSRAHFSTIARSVSATRNRTAIVTAGAVLLAGGVCLYRFSLISQINAASAEPAHSDSHHDAESASESPDLQKRNAAAYDEMKAIVGEDRISIDPEEREVHGKDAYSYHGDAPPYAVVYPLSTAEVSAILKVCSKYHLNVIPYGQRHELRRSHQRTARRYHHRREQDEQREDDPRCRYGLCR